MSGGWTVVDANTNKSQPITGKTDSGATSPYFMPAPGQQDPVGKMRVSQPQALIDTDFEYGPQPTKWETIALQNNRQSMYYIPQAPLAGISSIYGGFTTGQFSVSFTGNVTPVPTVGQPIYIQNSASPTANSWSYISAVVSSSRTLVTADVSISNGTGGFSISVALPAGSLIVGQPVTISGTFSGTGNIAGYVNPTTYYIGATNGTSTFTLLTSGGFALSTTAGTVTGTTLVAAATINCSTPAGVVAVSGPTVAVYLPSQTYAYLGYFYTGAGISLGSTTAFTNLGTTITVTTTAAHGLAQNSLIYVTGLTATTNPPNGAWVVATTPTSNTFTFNSTNTPTGTITNSIGQVKLFARPAGYVEYRTFDGGVAFSAGSVAPNAQLIRQTRRYFRYQSGKGIQFSTGTSLCPPLFTTSISSSGATATVTTRFAHNLAVGCVIRVQGCEQGAYNGTFTVSSVPSAVTFSYTMTSNPGTSPATGFPVRVSAVNWYGSSNRAGMFDQQNGLFFEYDGQQLYSVWRTSVLQINGTVAVTPGSAVITGTGTQFTTQLKAGDFIVLRGQSYRVVSIASTTSLVITPEYRGQATLSGVLVSKTVDTRVPRSLWSDPLDGTGPSGYTLDLTKMQMFYIDYSWYGAGFARWGLRTSKGQISYVYQQTNNNQQFEAYMRSGNLPAHYESNGISQSTFLLNGIGTSGYDNVVGAITATQTTITWSFNFGVLSSSVNGPGVVLIDSEYIYYANNTGSVLTGCIRGFGNTSPAPHANLAQISQAGMILADASSFAPSGTVRLQAAGNTGQSIEHITYGAKTGNILYNFTSRGVAGGGSATSFASSTAAEFFSPDSTAALSHWGSSVIMDGNFNDDKSLVFNYGTTTAVSIPALATVPLLAIRIAPSADNGTTGLLGVKEIINRSQLQLTDMAAAVTAGTGAVLVNLILNGVTTNFSGSFGTVAIGNTISSSLAQVAVNTSNTATISGGESVTALYATGVQQIDLSDVRDLGNSILGGGIVNTVPTTPAGVYPDGPDIIYVAVTNTTGAAISVLVRVNWKEAQA